MAKDSSNWANYKSLNRLWTGTGFNSPAGNPYKYNASKPDKYFFGIRRMPEKENKDEIENYLKGDKWKFHISVHPEDVALAWDSIVGYLQEEGVGSVKAALPAIAAKMGHRFRTDGETPYVQAGKMISLYPWDQIDGRPAHSVDDWQRILNDVEKRLAQAGIRKGQEIITDAKLTDSMYIYYRSDKMTKALDDFFEEIRELNKIMITEIIVDDYPMASERQFLKLTQSLTKERGIVIDKDEIERLAKKHLNDFTAQEIAASMPAKLKDTLDSRATLLNFPRYKRYKLANEEDIYADLHIEDPNVLRVLQEKAVKERGVQQR